MSLPSTLLNPEESLLANLAEAIQIVREGLRADGFGLERLQVQDGFQKLKALKDAKELINANDESLKSFEIAARAVFRKYKSCLTFAFLSGSAIDRLERLAGLRIIEILMDLKEVFRIRDLRVEVG